MRYSKMSVNKIENEKIEELKTTYGLDDIQIIDVKNIICVLVKTNNSNLRDNWRTINNEFSELLDEYLDSFYKKWNVYILYFTTDKVSKELKYKIENNTFFARKIFEHSNFFDRKTFECRYTVQLSDENIQNRISEYIDFTDLKIQATQPTQKKYESTSEIYLNLKDVDTASEEQIDELLKSLERTTNEI